MVVTESILGCTLESCQVKHLIVAYPNLFKYIDL